MALVRGEPLGSTPTVIPSLPEADRFSTIAAARAAAALPPTIPLAAFGGSMPRLSSVAQDEVTVSVPLGAEALVVVYRPSRLTPRLLEQIQAAEQGTASAVLDPLAALLVSWDLLDDETELPIPTTPDGLRGVPLTILVRVAEAVAGGLAAGVGR